MSEPDDALFSLSKTLGASLRALGLVARPRAPRPAELPDRVRFVALDPPRTDTSVGRGQWHKFSAAWRLMEESEAAYSTPFELVVRLRLDATPLDVFDPCSEVDTDDGLTVHAATDKAFWGRRPAMAVLARLHDAIGTEFDRVGSDPLMQRLPTRALLAAALSVPTAAWSQRKGERTHYNKVAMLPIPRVATVRPAASAVESAAAARSYTLGELHRALALPPRAGFKLQHGLRAASVDRQAGQFVAERDFLVWLLGNNVSVCDLGARTSALLYKGVRYARPSLPCGHAAGAADPPSAQPPAAFQAPRRVAVWHGQRWDRDLGFMYAPAIETLKAGFAAMGATVRIGVLPPDERSLGGAGAPRNKTRHAFPPRSRPPRPHFPLSPYTRTPRIHAGRSTLPPPHHARPRTWHHIRPTPDPPQAMGKQRSCP